jgi:tetratricopeptide (TPR) repeat protein
MKKPKIIYVLTLVLFYMTISCVRNDFQSGIQNLKKGEYQKALEDFNKEIKSNPNNIEAYTHRALCYSKLYEYGIDRNGRIKAISDYEYIVNEIDSFYAKAYFDMGLLQIIEKGRMNEKAAMNIFKAVMIDSSYRKDAITAFSNYNIEFEPTFNSYKASNLANNAFEKFRLKKYQEAIVEYTKAIKLNPNLAEAYYHRGLCKLYVSYINKYQASLADACLDFMRASNLGHPKGKEAVEQFCQKSN